MDLTRLKLILGVDDNSEDDLLTVLMEHSQWKIKAYLGLDEITTFPEGLQWVATELTAKRYNRLSSEGLLTEGTTGATATFQENDLDEFKPVLDNYLQLAGLTTKKGRLVML